ncbi:hypothetical protein MS3_00009133 [Schistosoma haematobium]|uniref:Uncharacterized protein n=1 Tax=Schistosoma haematobium TaxID=6185 RepID=A0A922LEA2_SCHHA|nr:hypothetical protein MS3_00009133 [Schistosoma haematobium]KAH9580501.1 hypothetical protein MS3_00009133 [Schistosoma haematobium]
MSVYKENSDDPTLKYFFVSYVCTYGRKRSSSESDACVQDVNNSNNHSSEELTTSNSPTQPRQRRRRRSSTSKYCVSMTTCCPVVIFCMHILKTYFDIATSGQENA